MSTTHPQGRPFGTSTYVNYGCRCEKCKASRAEDMRLYRTRGRTRLALIVQSRARSRAVTWVRQNHPDVWQQIRAEVLVDAERDHPELTPDLRK